MKAHSWTPEKLAAMATKDLGELRKNAANKNAHDLVAMCDSELSARKLPSPNKLAAKPKTASTDYVSEFHFVCGADRGVTYESDGTFWSGSWVVAEHEARRSHKYGAHLALHEAKSEPSYRQGKIVDLKIMDRGMVNKRNNGIAFRVKPTDEPMNWVGQASGEKGYKWSPLPQSGTTSEGDR